MAIRGLLEVRPEGLYCEQAGVFIDPWRPVERAVITHAHADHARWGMAHYLTAKACEPLLRSRLGQDLSISTLDYGEPLNLHGVRLSLHPAGHVLGSSQIRLEKHGFVAVVSGDYKLGPDPTCQPFEPVRCHHFVSESTFGLPIYQWENPDRIFAEINDWWAKNREAGVTGVIYAYSLGKAQRILAGVDASIGPIIVHGSIHKLCQVYEQSGIRLPNVRLATDQMGKLDRGTLVVAPPSVENSAWLKRFSPTVEAVASGWMTIRGVRRRRGVDRGFVLSDHADWTGLNEAIQQTGAERVSVTHGSREILARWLQAQGLEAEVLQTAYEGETDDVAPEAT